MKLAKNWHKSWSFWSSVLFSAAAVIEQMLIHIANIPEYQLPAGWHIAALAFVAIVRTIPQKSMGQ